MMCIVTGQVITIMDHTVYHDAVVIVVEFNMTWFYSFSNTNVLIQCINTWSCVEMLLKFTFCIVFLSRLCDTMMTALN